MSQNGKRRKWLEEKLKEKTEKKRGTLLLIIITSYVQSNILI